MMMAQAQKRIQRQIVNSAKVAFTSQNESLSMATEESKHRAKLPLYELEPKIEASWVAPNATVGKYPAPVWFCFPCMELTQC